jgi:hypothetical protein
MLSEQRFGPERDGKVENGRLVKEREAVERAS